MSEATVAATDPSTLPPPLHLNTPVADLSAHSRTLDGSWANDALTLLRTLGTSELTPPTPARLGLGAVGFLAAFVATVPSMPLAATFSVAATGLIAAVSATVLTGPAVIVLHQYLRLRARPADVASAIGQGFADGGHVALGLAPLVLFLAVTSHLALPTLMVLLGGSMLIVLLQTLRRLVHLEASAPGATLLQAMGMAGVSLAWVGLTALIAARIAASFLFPAFVPPVEVP